MTEAFESGALAGARFLLSTRHAEQCGRGMAVASPVARRLGASAIARVRQVHGTVVTAVPESIVPREAQANVVVERFLGEGDGLVTDLRGVAVAVVTADCVPLLLADRDGRAIAAVHAGWRGVAAGIVPRALRTLERLFGAPAARFDALLGPAAAGCCYEVGPEVVAALRPVVPDQIADGAWLRGGGGDRSFVDLRALVQAQLVALGVGRDRVACSSDCTICRNERWPSYRREGPRAGRIWSAIALPS